VTMPTLSSTSKVAQHFHGPHAQHKAPITLVVHFPFPPSPLPY
jgi:hypothetical protein